MNTGDSTRRGIGGDGALTSGWCWASGWRLVWPPTTGTTPDGTPGRPRPSVVVRAAKLWGRPISRLLAVGRR